MVPRTRRQSALLEVAAVVVVVALSVAVVATMAAAILATNRITPLFTLFLHRSTLLTLFPNNSLHNSPRRTLTLPATVLLLLSPPWPLILVAPLAAAVVVVEAAAVVAVLTLPT